MPLPSSSSFSTSFTSFDLLYLDGEVISSSSLLERKERLRDLLSNAGTLLQYSDHQIGSRERDMVEHAVCAIEDAYLAHVERHGGRGHGASLVTEGGRSWIRTVGPAGGVS
jgi:ATP-dependent DNA ligase